MKPKDYIIAYEPDDDRGLWVVWPNWWRRIIWRFLGVKIVYRGGL